MPTEPSATHHYFVAATPRSGSTLLCELLKGSGVAGYPNEDFQALRATSKSRQPRQYFDGVTEPFVDRLLPTDPGHAETDEEFARKLWLSRANSTTPNGVYGTKVMWGYFDDLGDRLATLPGLAGATRDEALRATFPGLKFVQIRRADKIGQAISLWTAVQTLTWRDEGDAVPDPTRPDPFYDFDGIHHLVGLQTAHEDAWSAWLAEHDFPSIAVDYDELAADPPAKVSGVVEWLDVPGGAEATVPEPKMKKQSGGRSAEWAARYRDDLAARAAGAAR